MKVKSIYYLLSRRLGRAQITFLNRWIPFRNYDQKHYDEILLTQNGVRKKKFLELTNRFIKKIMRVTNPGGISD